ncbi:bis-aminopropyl spermidine synthase family protein [Tessaracoccus sp. MC1679]|uniref:bis-aminopropyl spermidine synthase family protein n=1 Tax=Tessaracoccus sp. MC1679 TaxID=2760313 RepID=UPI002102A950|nr:bis-aminopropyl spermidine synthase family protein [Tessaracoccus sp. MC1679]
MCAERPAPDARLEQFLMTTQAVEHQAAYLSRTLSSDLVILGDDDHISIPVALIDPRRKVLVIDTDHRVLASLAQWINRLEIGNVELIHADLRNYARPPGAFEAFYANPPWSSKNGGHGLRYWLSRALDLCTPSCAGVLALPGNDLGWINSNWLSMQEYSAQNGLRWVEIDAVRCQYEHTNQAGLYSQNVHMQRTDPQRRLSEQARQGEGIYR